LYGFPAAILTPFSVDPPLTGLGTTSLGKHGKPLGNYYIYKHLFAAFLLLHIVAVIACRLSAVKQKSLPLFAEAR